MNVHSEHARLGHCKGPFHARAAIGCNPRSALLTRWVRIASLVSLGLLLPPALPGAVVADCTEQALRNAIDEGGTVTFAEDCSITLSQQIAVSKKSTTIDASGYTVSISGGNAVRLFKANTNLTLIGLKLSNGRSTLGGALYIPAGVTVTARDCIFADNSAIGADGADGYAGSDVSSGKAGDGGDGVPGGSGLGGAICNLGSLTLDNCTLTNNTASGGNGGAGGDGGATSNFGLSVGGDGGDGAAGGVGEGGAVYNQGDLTIFDCIVAGNQAEAGSGGAPGAAGTGAFDGWPGAGGAGAGASGGGVCSAKNLRIWSSSIYANTCQGGDSAKAGTEANGKGNQGAKGGAARGGGLLAVSWGVVTNCTFYSNTVYGGKGGDGGDGLGSLPQAGDGGDGGNGIGGAVYNSGSLSLVNSTLAGSGAYGGTNGVAGTTGTAGSDGQVGASWGGNIANDYACTIRGSIFASPTSGGCGHGTFIDAGYNISSDGTMSLGGSSLANTNPKLNSPAMNGGPTPTMGLQGDSPAINKIPKNDAPVMDQRGVPRPLPLNGLADVGAYEYELASGPVIITQPSDAYVNQSASVTFTVSATGGTPLTYQWRYDGDPITNATSSSYTVTAAMPTNEGPYDVEIANTYGYKTTNSAAVSIYLLPGITSPPTDLSVVVGSNAAFQVTANGDPTLTYQWQFENTDIPGATASSLRLTNVQTANGGTYTVIVDNGLGHPTNASATLSLLPTILQQPASLTVMAGEEAGFSVSADGTPSLGYQWRRNGATLSGATNSAFVIPQAQIADAGTYDVVITNGVGQATSTAATLSVFSPFTLAGRVLNASRTSGMPGVTVRAGTNLVLTDATGRYQFSGLASNAYTITPSLACYSFTPPGLALVLTNNLTLTNQFVGMRDNYAISGRFTNQLGAPVSNLVVVAGSGATRTDTNGFYSFTNLCAGSYTVVPGTACYQFTPELLQVTLGPDSAPNSDFLAVPDLNTISGFITEGTTALSNVMVVAGGHTNFTDATGLYLIGDLCPGTYTVTPYFDCHVFNPASRSVDLGPSLDQVNFLAFTNDAFTIRGRVTTDGVNGLGGVQITAGNQTITTLSDGTYVLAHVCPGTYDLTPLLAGYGFNPAKRSVQVAADVSGQDFVAFSVFTISGRVTQNGIGFAGVTVRTTNQSTNTDANGDYWLTGLAAGTYSITPTQACSLFTPSSRTVTVGPNSSGNDFVALTNNVFALRGRVTEAIYPLGGVTLTMGSRHVTSSADGYFSFISVCPGSNAISASLPGYSFRPAVLPVYISADLSGLNFAAVPIFTISNLDGAMDLHSFGSTGITYQIDVSGDLTKTNWVPLITNSAPLHYLDSEATNFNQRIYRLSR